MELLKIQQTQAPLPRGYFAGNAIHLLRQIEVDLSYLDFANLTILQADLRMVNINKTNFRRADLSYFVFSQSIADILSVGFSPDANTLPLGTMTVKSADGSW